MSSWMNWFPERYQEEIDAYAHRSMAVIIDEESRARGTLCLNVTLEEVGELYKIRIVYPSLFPFFAPKAFLLERKLSRHYHPESCNLCLLGRGTHQWSSDDKFADVVAERFPTILKINQTSDESFIKAAEEPQGEPYSEYFNGNGVPDSAIIYHSGWEIDSSRKMGTAVLRVAGTTHDKRRLAPIRGYVAELRNNGDTLVQWPGPQIPNFSRELKMPWVLLDEKPEGARLSLLNQLTEQQKIHVGWKELGKNKSITFLFIFQEEIEQFVYKQSIGCISIYVRPGVDQQAKKTSHQVWHQRTFRAGREELWARMPGLSDLTTKKVGVFGTGAIGAPVALELARAGVGTLRVIDFDYVEPATVRRWPFGVSAFGLMKIDVLAENICNDYPWTQVEKFPLNVGEISADPTENQFQQILDIMQDLDLIIDTTAENGVNEILATISSQLKRPFLVASGTPGAWGGYVARFKNDQQDACWNCLMHDFYGEKRADDLPPADPEGTRQPPGCPAITFTGTAVDLAEISLEVVRSAFGLLTSKYPSPSEQISILSLRQDDGSRSAPQWLVRHIARLGRCKCQS